MPSTALRKAPGGAQERRYWEAVASANPLLERTLIYLLFEGEGEDDNDDDEIEEEVVDYGKYVKECEVIDIVLPFSACPQLRRLTICEEDFYPRLHRRVEKIADACIPLRWRKHVEDVCILE